MNSSVHAELLKHTISPYGRCACGTRMGRNRFRHWNNVYRTLIAHPSMTSNTKSKDF